MIKEQVQGVLESSVLINELKKKFTDFECYKLGIIDNQGNKIKHPITEKETASYGLMTKTVIKLKKYLGSKVDLLEAETNLKLSSMKTNEDITRYEMLLEHRAKIESAINSLYQVISEAEQSGLSLEEINNLLKA